MENQEKVQESKGLKKIIASGFCVLRDKVTGKQIAKTITMDSDGKFAVDQECNYRVTKPIEKDLNQVITPCQENGRTSHILSSQVQVEGLSETQHNTIELAKHEEQMRTFLK